MINTPTTRVTLKGRYPDESLGEGPLGPSLLLTHRVRPFAGVWRLKGATESNVGFRSTSHACGLKTNSCHPSVYTGLHPAVCPEGECS